MGHGVVADEMTGGCDGASDLWALTDVVADEEECGAGVVLGEYVEEAFGGEVVGAVVVGEGDLVWVRSGDEELAEELGLRGERGVGDGAGCCGCGGEEGCGGLCLCHACVFFGSPPPLFIIGRR